MHSRQMKCIYPTRLSYTYYICKHLKVVPILHQCTLAENLPLHKNLDEKKIIVTLVVIFKLRELLRYFITKIISDVSFGSTRNEKISLL